MEQPHDRLTQDQLDELPFIATTCTNCHEEVKIFVQHRVDADDAAMAETVIDTAASLMAGLTTYANSVFEQLAVLSGNLEALREGLEPPSWYTAEPRPSVNPPLPSHYSHDGSVCGGCGASWPCDGYREAVDALRTR